MAIKLKPLADRVVIEPAEAEQKTAGGIIIPDTAKEKPQKGTVVAVGPGKKRRTHDPKGRRYRPLRQIFRYRNHPRHHSLPHYEGE